MVDRKTAVYPGSFDPLTHGHLDLVLRARKIFPNLVVAVANNPGKKPWFSDNERTAMIAEVLKKAGAGEVEVDSFSGLLVDYVKKRNVSVVLRGLRALSDFENEFQMAHVNRSLLDNLETFFMMTGQEHFYVSSQTVREVAYFGGDVSGLVPPCVAERLQEKARQIRSARG